MQIAWNSAVEVADWLFTGKIPELYDSLLVPLIFEPYARDLAFRVTETEPIDILETATGTGALTRELTSRLPATARNVATDLNHPMLDHGVPVWRDVLS